MHSERMSVLNYSLIHINELLCLIAYREECRLDIILVKNIQNTLRIMAWSVIKRKIYNLAPILQSLLNHGL